MFKVIWPCDHNLVDSTDTQNESICLYLSCSGKYNENYVLNHEKSITEFGFFLGEKSGMGSLTSTKTCMNPTKIREATHSPEIIQ